MQTTAPYPQLTPIAPPSFVDVELGDQQPDSSTANIRPALALNIERPSSELMTNTAAGDMSGGQRCGASILGSVAGAAVGAGLSAGITAAGTAFLKAVISNQDRFDFGTRESAIAGSIGGAIFGGVSGALIGCIADQLGSSSSNTSSTGKWTTTASIPLSALVGAAIMGDYPVLEAFLGELTGEALVLGGILAIGCPLLLCAAACSADRH